MDRKHEMDGFCFIVFTRRACAKALIQRRISNNNHTESVTSTSLLFPVFKSTAELDLEALNIANGSSRDLRLNPTFRLRPYFLTAKTPAMMRMTAIKTTGTTIAATFSVWIERK